jgi:hypothetical protein
LHALNIAFDKQQQQQQDMLWAGQSRENGEIITGVLSSYPVV